MTTTNGHYAYYPGCSMHSNARAYELSTQAIAEVLDLRFQEVDDWNCCGATEYFSLDKLPAYSLVATNLAKAAQQDTHELVAPCSACYLNLRKTDHHMDIQPKLNDQVNRALAAGGLHYEPGHFRVRHLLDIIVEDVGIDAVAEHVSQPLKGLRIAPYYGCLIVRPFADSNPEYPTHMDDLLTALGATVVDFPMKAHCCGGHMTQISEETALELMRRILSNAAAYATDMIVTVCPMCQLNLDAYQGSVNRLFGTNYNLPVLYFTQMMGLAFGLSEKALGIGSEIVSPRQALRKIGQEAPPTDKRPKRRDKKALPMPR